MQQKYMRHLLPLTGEKILGAKEGKTPLNTYSDELSHIYRIRRIMGYLHYGVS